MTVPCPDDETPSSELAPRRLIEGGAGEHERSLVASARLDRVPDAAKARVAAGLGHVLELRAASGAPASGLEPCAGGAALPRFVDRWSPGVVGAGVVGAIALALWLRATPEERPSAGRARELAPEVNATLAEPHHLPRPSVASPSPKSAAPSSTPEARSSAELEKQTAPARPERPAASRSREGAGAKPRDSGLLAEVRALEAVRSAIGAGRADRATRELDAYHRRFAHGELSVEADVLAIQLAVARGENAVARAAAERLLARPEAQHYRARVSALLEGQGERSKDAAAHIRARR
jgi:hypothetical protein